MQRQGVGEVHVLVQNFQMEHHAHPLDLALLEELLGPSEYVVFVSPTYIKCMPERVNTYIYLSRTCVHSGQI